MGIAELATVDVPPGVRPLGPDDVGDMLGMTLSPSVGVHVMDCASIGAQLPLTMVSENFEIRVAIAVDDNALDRVQELARECRALGFRADSTLTGAGVFTGYVQADKVAALRALPGVAAVEMGRVSRIHRSPDPVRYP